MRIPKLLFTVCGLVASMGAALATPTNITQEDFATDYNSFVGDGSSNAAGADVQGLNNGYEDNETERVGNFKAIAGQAWDLEAFVVDGNLLSIVGGYDFLNGLAEGRPGDLFIEVGPNAPTYNPLSNPPGGLISNAGYGWDYVVDLSLADFDGTGTYNNAAGFGPFATVRKLEDDSQLHTVENDQFGSNPWKYHSGAPIFGVTTVSYSTMADPFSLGLVGSVHNVLQIDLGFLDVDPGETVWFSYTMECGNDSMKGKTSSGFLRVPDSGTSLMLVGLGLVAMAGARRSLKRV